MSKHILKLYILLFTHLRRSLRYVFSIQTAKASPQNMKPRLYDIQSV